MKIRSEGAQLACQEHGMTRAQQEVDVIYVLPDETTAFFTPDGEGRIYYDTVAEAIADTGLDEIIHLSKDPEDW